MRISKYISHSNYCSRREAEKLILNNRVMLNGQIISNPATQVNEESRIQIDNQLLLISKPCIWLYYKPTGIIVSRCDEKKRKTIFDILPQHLKNLITIGRLDYNSEGLLLLTNNGDLARYMEIPSNNVTRKYKVRVFGKMDSEHIITQLESGIFLENLPYKPIKTKINSISTYNHWITMTLTEGKNREIRKILYHFGLSISKLIRIEHGPFKLGKLTTNSVIAVPQKIVDEYVKKLSFN